MTAFLDRIGYQLHTGKELDSSANRIEHRRQRVWSSQLLVDTCAAVAMR
jgi:hypothetical protein